MLYNILLFSLALSLDAYGVGITLGLRKIKISNFSRFIIGIVSFCFTCAGMLLGKLVLSHVPQSASKYISTCMIFLIGVNMLLQGLKKEKTDTCNKKSNLKNTASILSQPEKSDMDNSKSIDPHEAMYLASALSVDAFFSTAALNCGGITTFALPIMITVFQVAAISMGQFTGSRIRNLFSFDSKKWAILSGSIIMIAALVFLI
ncbi:MAG: manganese efflux pump [Clostridia bacterium]|jgi:putative sporulation protein YtaF|nr:manganese efflux pump [Clostridia bacterium]MCI2000180.1 manganese efflux pump [Clostridia bacterium]MCI2014655.1 manganese efflux pump [Clostridia bacterium]